MELIPTKVNSDGTQSLSHKHTFLGHFNEIFQEVDSEKRVVTVKAPTYTTTITWYKSLK